MIASTPALSGALACVLACVLAAGLAAQDPPSKAPGDDALSLVGRAEKLHAAGSDEAAARLLRQAQRALQELPVGPTREGLAKTIQGLLQRVDSRCAAYDDALARSAGELIRTARTYQRRKWTKLADRLLDDAERLSPELAGKERKRSTGSASRGRGAAAKNKAGDPSDLMPRFNPSDGWTLRDGIVTSPPFPSSGSSVVLGSLQALHDARVSMEVKRPDTNSLAATIFGAKTHADYFLFDLLYYDGTKCRAVAYHWKDPELKTLGTKTFSMTPAQRADWVDYTVETVGTRATLSINGNELMSVTCPREPHGMVGMLVSGASEYRGPVQYRKLRIAKVDEKPDPAAGDGSADLLATLAKAEKLLAARNNESATLLLLDAAEHTAGLANPTVRETVEASIEKLYRRADRSYQTWRRARGAAAAALVRAAETYAESHWFAMAGELLDAAAPLDPATVTEVRTALDEKAAAAKQANIAAAAERDAARPAGSPTPASVGPADKAESFPAERQTGARNFDLLLWFEGGEVPVGKDAWTASTAYIEAPSRTPGDAIKVSSMPVSDKAEIDLQVRAGPKESMPGFVFGYTGKDSYYVFVWHHAADGYTTAQLHRVAGGKRTPVGNWHKTRFSAGAREQWMTLQARFGDKSLRFKLGAAPELVIPAPDGGFAGRIGLFSQVQKSGQAVQFRNLTFRKE